MATCKQCGKSFQYNDEVGYSEDLCGAYCDGAWWTAKHFTQRLAAAEALLREAVTACRREFLQTTGPNTEWYDATRLMRDWFERAQAAVG